MLSAGHSSSDDANGDGDGDDGGGGAGDGDDDPGEKKNKAKQPIREPDDLRASLLSKLRARGNLSMSGASSSLQSLADTLERAQASWDDSGGAGAGDHVSYCWNAALGAHKKCGGTKGVVAYVVVVVVVFC